jgi:hypothetical protein
MTKSFVFYSDPGHGWLAVKSKLILAMNLQDKISAYSYVKGKTCYLEEDCDAAVFFEKYKELFGKSPEYTTKSTDKKSPIRSYDRFSCKNVMKAFKDE